MQGERFRLIGKLTSIIPPTRPKAHVTIGTLQIAGNCLYYKHSKLLNPLLSNGNISSRSAKILILI